MRAARIFGKHWKLTLIAVFSLSVAMALGVIAISISNTFLFLPPAAPAADRLVMIYGHSATEDVGEISYPDYKYFQANNHVFSDLAAAPNSISISLDPKFGKGNAKVISRPVSGNYFTVMGIRPYLGRLLLPEDETGDARAAMMTYSCWMRLGADGSVVGKKLSGNTIVGVLPKEFTGSMYGINGDLMVAMSESNFPPLWRTDRESRHLILTGRLKPGVSRRQAQAEITTLSGQLATAYPKEDKDHTAVVTRATLLPPDGIATARLMSGILMAVVLLVLLIACANVANLLLAIAVGRRQEAAIKLALGAQRSRLVREFMKESAILSIVSGLAGFGLAAFGIVRYSHISVQVPTVGAVSFEPNLHLDATVAAFTIGLMLIAIVATGLAPALYASAPSLAQVLSGELVVGGTGKAMRRNVLVAVQVAVCTLVLVGMGLCERSLYNLRRVDPGFNGRNLVAMATLSEDNLTETQTKAIFADLREKVAALPGVESVALASELPLLGSGNERMRLPGDTKNIDMSHTVVDEDYFKTLGIRVLSGRVFTKFDRENSPEVVVINHKMAETYWPGQDAVGKVVLLGDKFVKSTIIGVVADGKYEDLDEAPRSFLYHPLSQHHQGAIYVVARVKGDPQLWIAPLAQAMRDLHLMALDPLTYDTWLDLALFVERMTVRGAAALSGLGLLLAVIGLFGAISYSVSERRKELGIRVALGARPVQLLQMILKHTLVVAGTGVGIGVAMGVGATMLLRSQFYGISTVEWSVLIPVSAAMLGVSAAVAYVSARPWLSIDPMDAVRHA